MGVSKIFVILSLLGYVFSEGGTFFDPCYKNDIKCLSTASEQFLEISKNGIKDTDIKPIDPLIIPSLDVAIDKNLGINFHFKNINVTGMKNQKLHDYTMDTTKKSVVLKTKVNLNIEADITIKFTKKSKGFSGSYSAVTSVLETSQYGYSLRKSDKDGLEYFDVGPETNNCEIIGEPNVTIGEILQDALNNDVDAKAAKPDYEAHKDELRKHTLCKIIEVCYIRVLNNLRVSATMLPKTAFFKDM